MMVFKHRWRMVFLGGILIFICLFYKTFVSVEEKDVSESDIWQEQIPQAIGEKTANVTVEPGFPILIWWAAVSGSRDHTASCGDVRCVITADQTLQHHPRTQAFLFYGTDFVPYHLPLPRRAHHLWSLLHEESPKNNYGIFSFEETMTLFNLTSTFKRESDYPISLQSLPSLEWLEDRKFLVSIAEKNRLRSEGLAPIMYIQSDCGAPSDRDSYVKLLQHDIPVDSYGRCLNNKELPESLRFVKSMAPMHSVEFFKFSARYKFVLAMENAVCNDYMTEKLWRPLHLGIVPIVFGSSRVKDFLPSNRSAVVVNDFNTAKDLAKYIKYLDANDEEYEKYLSFKLHGGTTNKYLLNELKSRDWGNPSYPSQKSKPYHSFFQGFECFVCHKAHIIKKKVQTGELLSQYKASLSQYGCPAPAKFDSVGKYIEDPTNWMNFWENGKNRAKALSYFHSQHVAVNKTTFEAYVRQLGREDRFPFLKKQLLS